MKAELVLLYRPWSTSDTLENPIETSRSIPRGSEMGYNFLCLLFRQEIFCVYLHSGQNGLNDLSFTVPLSLFLCMFFPKKREISFQ